MSDKFISIEIKSKSGGELLKRKNGKRLQGYILTAQNKNKKELLRYMYGTVQTWEGKVQGVNKNAIPDFVVKYSYAGGNWAINAYPTGNADGVYKWETLNKGKKDRHDVLTPGFVPKTKPGRVFAKVGKGGFDYWSPFPVGDIEARRWNLSVKRLMLPKFKRNLREAIINWSKK